MFIKISRQEEKAGPTPKQNKQWNWTGCIGSTSIKEGEEEGEGEGDEGEGNNIRQRAGSREQGGSTSS